MIRSRSGGASLPCRRRWFRSKRPAPLRRQARGGERQGEAAHDGHGREGELLAGEHHRQVGERHDVLGDPVVDADDRAEHLAEEVDEQEGRPADARRRSGQQAEGEHADRGQQPHGRHLHERAGQDAQRVAGAQLFLSPKTVGHHLYRAFPKLGVSNRTELARLHLT
ncbi:LuxR family transcriptional regulator [Nonomuraea africana]|uniref:LuxR family transcriptional regulator n=1 Tax=Nonomuraea africana TaxID=46171 RepID=UPI00378BA73B